MKNEGQVSKKQNRVGNFPTLRLTFSYEGSDVQLVSRQSVEIVPLPSDPIHAQEPRTGFWYELRDVKGLTLYRRTTQNPIKFATEVRSDDPEHPLMWQKVSEPKGSFMLLMPDLKEAQTLVLFSSPLDPEEATGPAKEITRFDLTKTLKARR